MRRLLSLPKFKLSQTSLVFCLQRFSLKSKANDLKAAVDFRFQVDAGEGEGRKAHPWLLGRSEFCVYSVLWLEEQSVSESFLF